MTTIASTWRQSKPAAPVLWFALAALLIAVAVASVTMAQPVLLLAALVVIPAAATLFMWPELATIVVMFILYSNAAVVAVKFHGVPMMFAAAVPLLLLVPASRNVFSQGRGIVLTPAMPFIAAFIVVQLAGAMFAPRPSVALDKVFTSIAEGAVLYVLIVNIVRTPRALKQVLWTLCAAGAFMGAVVAHQQVTRNFDFEYGGFGQVTEAVYVADKENGSDEDGQPRLAGPIGEKNRYGQVMAMVLPVAMFLFLSATGTREKALAMGAFLLIGIGIAASLSRGAAIGLAIVFVMMVAFGYIRLSHLWILLPGILVAAIVVPDYAARLGSLQAVAGILGFEDDRHAKGPDGSLRGRATEMIAGVLMFGDHPVIGVGPGMYHFHYRRYAKKAGGKVEFGGRQAHSLYLGMAAEHGLLGLLAFTGILWVTLRDMFRARTYWLARRLDMANITTGLIAALIVYLTSAIFLHMAYARYFWVMLAVSTTVSCLANDREPGTARTFRAGEMS